PGHSASPSRRRSSPALTLDCRKSRGYYWPGAAAAKMKSGPIMGPSIGRRTILTGASSLLAAPVPLRAQPQSAGVALVIGNSKYKWEAPLPNVRRDARDVA